MPEKSSFFYLIGETNSGKSTLMNALACRKVSIVTHKVQTTNVPFYASFDYKDATIFLLDTPGLFRKNHQTIVNIKGLSFQHIENKSVLFLVDAYRKDLSMSKSFIENHLLNKGNSIYLVINKIDKVDKERFMRIIEDFRAISEIKEFFLISALKNKGLTSLQELLYSQSIEGFNPDELNNFMHVSKKFLCSEITREKIYQNIHDEIPYSCTVETEIVDEKIFQTVHVPRAAYVPILLGAGGQQIKKIGILAREEISSILGHPYSVFIRIAADKKNRKKS